MNEIYNFGISCYQYLVSLAALKSKKARLLKEGQKTIFDYLDKTIVPGERYVWFHASSLGEFEQGRPLIEALKQQRPEQKIIVTFFSPSGYEVRKNYDRADAICYLPLDKPAWVKRFLDTVNPSIAIFIKYEFWANYLTELSNRQIPTYIVSAIFRKSQLFFKPFGGFYRTLLTYFDQLFVQDENSQSLLSSIGIDQVTVCGDTRFDRVLDIARQAKKLPLAEQFVQRAEKTLVAGSSWPKDEDIFIEYFNRHPELKLIIAPHVIDEEHLKEIESKLKRPHLRYTQASPENIAQAECLIIDCFGLLSSLYRYGQIAYVGGGFGVGIHNVPEAAVYGIPVIFGPNYHKFKEACDLIKCGGAFSITGPDAFETIMERLVSSSGFRENSGKAAQRYIADNSGASKVILKDIFGIDLH